MIKRVHIEDVIAINLLSLFLLSLDNNKWGKKCAILFANLENN